MKECVINLDKLKEKKSIKEIISKIIRVVNINHIYLGIGREEQPFKYKFILVVEEMAKRFKQGAKITIEECFQDYDGYNFSVFTVNIISNETNNGNTFFLNNCKESNLIYYNTAYNPKWLFKKIDLSKVIKTAEHNFTQEKERIESFKEGAMMYLKEKKYEQAAFMLHQTIELGFMVAERFLTGKSFRGHLIGDHQTYIGTVNNEFAALFPRANKKQTNLLNKLNQAYSKTRYALDFKLGKEQVYEIKEKSDKMIKLLETHATIEIKKCKKTISSVALGSDNYVAEPYNQKEKRKELSTLEKIRELSEQNLNLLSPIGGIKKGHYLNHVRVYDYSELFDTLKSMLNVCILALDEQQDCTLDIYHKESDVKRVLGLAKNLIPFEEGNFLDEIYELMLKMK